ncbi:MAG: Ig-like domain-containing protein, partial [Planctomycetota bacterium]|nr:Ig-like domain-containing protein [Planctomycetota bacterium]
MRGRTGVILAAMIAGFYLTGCLSGITAGIILGSDGGGGHGRGNNAAPSVAITTAFPPSVPLLEDVTVDFSVSDQEGDLVDILVEVSQDGGVTYLPATVTGTLTGLSASPAGWPATITWDTYADVGSTAQNDIRLRVTPFDPKQGTPGMTGNLTVDNTHLPDIYEVDNDTAGANPLVPFAAAQVHSIHEPGDLDYVSIQVTSNIQRYTIETSNLTGGDTILTLFDTDGITILAENDDRAGGGIASRVDFIFPSLGTYFARVRDTTSAYLYVYDLTLTVVPPTTPSATVETPTGPVSGPVTITYVLIDPDENPVSISVELSQDGGSSFTSATEMPGPPSDGTTGLQTSALGVTHQFVWNSVSDVGTTDQADIQIRLTPFDSATGTPSTTASFRVDNLAPQIASAEYIDMDFDGPDFGDTLEITFSEPIVLGSPTLSAFSLPVGGDTFGNASFILSGPGADQITILLGSSPSLIVAGVFDPASLSAGSPSGMDISASLPSNAITDDAGNEATNYGDPALDDDGVDIGSPDVATPFLGTASAQALSGASNDEVGIQFSEPVIAADAEDISLFVLESPSGSPVDMGGAGVFYNPTTLTTTITLTDTGPQMDNLAYQGSFRIIVTGVRDVAGNPITPGSFLSGTVGGDGASPALLSVNQNLVAGPGGETVDLQFDEAMDPLTANDPVHYAVSGGQLTLSAVLLTGLRQVRIVFDSPIVPGVTTIDVADVRDLAGNVIAAIAGRAIGGPDATPPGLSGIGAVAISGLLNDQISVTFTESVDVTDATDLANFALESPTGIPIDMAGSAISYSAASATTTITLSSTGPSADNLQFGASAQVTVDNVRDLSGNPIAAGSSFAGTVTGDNTPPQILTVRQDLAPDPTGATVEVTFDEALDRASAETSANYTASGGIGTTSATQTPSGERVQVLLTAPVVSGKDTLSVLAVKDAAGNPMVSASNLTMTSTDSTPPVATIVQPADGADVSQSVTVTGTATDDHSLITAIRVNGMAASTGDDFANWTAAIALPTGTQSITVEAEDFNGNVDPSAAQITVNVQGNTPPKATVSTPGGTQIGDVPVAYRLIDDDSDLISISVEYSLDGGGSFFSATESLNPLSEGTLGLSSSSDPGTLHVFVWDSLADLGLASTTQARIRITPSDAVTGTAGVTANFAVNNLGDPAPFIVGSVFEDTEGNGVGQGDRITVLFNEPVVLNTASVSAFSLPVAGDTFGSGATVAAGFASTEIVITLGSVPILTVPGRYVSPVAGMPSGIDISQTMPAGAIEDSVGNDAIPVSSTLSTGSGLDGPFDSVTYTSGDLPGITKVGATITVDTDDAAQGGIYEFTSFVLAPSDTLVAYGSKPLVIQAIGNITVDGTIDLSGQAGGDSGRGLPAGSGGVP